MLYSYRRLSISHPAGTYHNVGSLFVYAVHNTFLLLKPDNPDDCRAALISLPYHKLSLHNKKALLATEERSMTYQPNTIILYPKQNFVRRLFANPPQIVRQKFAFFSQLKNRVKNGVFLDKES
jgi:hypothetical protein